MSCATSGYVMRDLKFRIGGGLALECGDELLAEFDCDERSPPPLPQPVAEREEDVVRGATGSENEDGGGSALE